jgi:hypothetical protein
MTQLNASVNQSERVEDLSSGPVNAYKYKASDVNATDFGAFPHSKDDVSALDASEWSTDASSTAGSVSVSDVTTAPDVDAVQVSTSSQTTGDVAAASFSNFSVTSDVEKRYLQTVMDVSMLDAGAEVQLQAVDADGDYVEAIVNASATATNEDVIGTATGEGYVFQRRLAR